MNFQIEKSTKFNSIFGIFIKFAHTINLIKEVY